MSKTNSTLQKVYQLLLKEKEFDYNLYKNKILFASLKDKKNEGVCWYPVIIRSIRIGTGEKQVLEIERTSGKNMPHAFQSGNVIRLFSNTGSPGKSDTQGVVNYIKKNEIMVITLNSDELPDWIDDGKLGVDLLFDEASYKEMEAAMKRIINVTEGQLKELKEILSGNDLKPKFEPEQAISIPHLNKSQNDALSKVLCAKDIAIIHGPPGTGKTTTLVAAIKVTLQKENQLLVCAPSNAAVDLLVEKLSKENIEVIRIGHPARINDDVLNNTIDHHIANHVNFRDIKNLRKKAEEFKRLAVKYKRKYEKAERQQRKLLFAESSRCLADADLLEHFIINDLFQKAQVIATTLVGASHYLLKGKSFSTVFIDEAAQALEPACWIPIIKSVRVIMAGDHQQLPPTIKSIEAAREGLNVTLFEKCIRNNDVGVLLNKQYRMHHKIMNFSSRKFYHSELMAEKSVHSQLIFPSDIPFLFIDTAGCGFTEKINPDTRSYFNVEEANLLLKHLSEYLEKVGQPVFVEKNLELGIISPYKGQVILLRDSLETNPAFNEFLPFINIDTIDAFQGRERTIIYISLVRSNNQSEIGFLKDIRRINVAMTRAKMKLVMIGDSATLGNFPFYSELLDHVMEEKSYQSAFEIMYE